ncbi:MAG TPA: hypothetical protein VK466_01645 [Terriglobales bacterium]|nr:hypothetical protein [Terriglobales bacterium]
MRDTLCFSTFDPLFSDAPSLCDLCRISPSAFQFRNATSTSESQPARGFCCPACANVLLGKLERAESLVWEQEEASVEAEGADASELHKRRMATFGARSKT